MPEKHRTQPELVRITSPAALGEVGTIGMIELVDRSVLGCNVTPTPAVIREQLEQLGVVKALPSLQEQAQDTTRMTPFTYMPIWHALGRADTSHTDFNGIPRVTLTEHQGLQGLLTFIDAATGRPDIHRYIAYRLTEIKDYLSFMGDSETREAAAGVAIYVKDFLSSNKGNQICLPMPLRKMYTKASASKLIKPKSDEYVLDRMFGSFTDEELVQYAPQIKLSVDELSAPHEQTKIMLFDDRSISNFQLQVQYVATIASLHNRPEYISSIEAMLLLITKDQAENGVASTHRVLADLATSAGTETQKYKDMALRFVPDGSNYDRQELEMALASTPYAKTLPVKGYFMAHECKQVVGRKKRRPICSSLKAAADFRFEDVIGTVVEASDDLTMPPLTNIIRGYRDEPLVHIARLHEALRTKAR